MNVFYSRNYDFFERLPKRFSIRVKSEINRIDRGIWYCVEIDGHELSLLSKVDLEGNSEYLVEKASPLSIKVLKKHLEKDSSNDFNSSKIDLLI